MRVTVADSGVCCCVCATSVGRYVGPLFVDSFRKGDIHHTRNCPPLQLWCSYALSGKGTYIILETATNRGYSFDVLSGKRDSALQASGQREVLQWRMYFFVCYIQPFVNAKLDAL